MLNLREAGPHRADRIEEIAAQKGCTPSQLALAWVLAQGEEIVPIPGTKRRKYLEENAAAADIMLTAEDLRRIDELAPHGWRRAPATRTWPCAPSTADTGRCERSHRRRYLDQLRPGKCYAPRLRRRPSEENE